MRIQSQKQQVDKLRGSKSVQRHIPWKRLIALALALVLIVGGTSIWIAQSTNHGFWSNVFSIIFVAGGIVVGLLQWLFPISSHNSDSSDSQQLPLSQKTRSSPVVTHSPATASNKHYHYDVALSYAGEDLVYAQALADSLRSRGVNVFYDKYEKSTLWGKNLYDYLTDLYQHKARYCVMLLSQHYAAKVWTNLERQAAQARAFQEHQEYILPVRLDDTEISGILPIVGYLRWPPETAETITDVIITKLS
jgi:TIR domain